MKRYQADSHGGLTCILMALWKVHVTGNSREEGVSKDKWGRAGGGPYQNLTPLNGREMDF